MTRHSEFKMESRRYGGGHTNFVAITCGWCQYEAWYPAKNGGWAMRIFRAHGWKVGSKDAQHRCPKCFGKAMASRRSPDNPVIPRELGKAIKTAMMEAHVKDSLMTSAAVIRPPREKPAQDPFYVADVIVPATAEEPPAAAPEPAVAPSPPEETYLTPRRGHYAVPGRTKWPADKRSLAAASGTTATKSVDGIDFLTLPLGDGWTWKLARDCTPEEHRAWRESRRFGPAPKPASIIRMTALAQEEPQMTTNVTPLTRKDPMPAASTSEEVAQMASSIVSHVAAVPPAQPTRDQRSLIHDELTKVYDTVDQRYLKADSDKVVGERLDVPRVWVTDIRVGFFGDHDRNSQTEKHKKDLDAVIIMASGAAKRLMEMAAEAESLEQNLIAARKKLGE